LTDRLTRRLLLLALLVLIAHRPAWLLLLLVFLEHKLAALLLLFLVLLLAQGLTGLLLLTTKGLTRVNLQACRTQF
jgi:hypothetical protein